MDRRGANKEWSKDKVKPSEKQASLAVPNAADCKLCKVLLPNAVLIEACAGMLSWCRLTGTSQRTAPRC